jgi:thiamine-phosphate pyrophosphorylase
MPRRQPNKNRLPKLWLMTDARLGDGLLAAVCRLPRGSGVVFRHYDLAEAERRALFADVRRICRQRGHRLLVAGNDLRGADGVHGRKRSPRAGLHSAPAHNQREIRAACRVGARLILLSPLYPTRSHPGVRALGLLRFAQLARLAHPAKVIALGGVTRNRARSIKASIAYGWAAIDAFRK